MKETLQWINWAKKATLGMMKKNNILMSFTPFCPITIEKFEVLTKLERVQN
jgi:hypothetical protein